MRLERWTTFTLLFSSMQQCHVGRAAPKETTPPAWNQTICLNKTSLLYDLKGIPSQPDKTMCHWNEQSFLGLDWIQKIISLANLRSTLDASNPMTLSGWSLIAPISKFLTKCHHNATFLKDSSIFTWAVCKVKSLGSLWVFRFPRTHVQNFRSRGHV